MEAILAEDPDTDTAETAKVAKIRDGMPVKFICIVRGAKQHNTKKGAAMAFVTAEVLSGECEIIFFPEVFGLNVNNLRAGNYIFVSGKVSLKDDSVKIIADTAMSADAYEHLAQKAAVYVKCKSDEKEKTEKILHLCGEHIGNGSMNFYFEDIKKYVRPKGLHGIDVTDEFLGRLGEIAGTENIALKE
jgi:DNA polymerase-3 subunit alpha